MEVSYHKIISSHRVDKKLVPPDCIKCVGLCTNCFLAGKCHVQQKLMARLAISLLFGEQKNHQKKTPLKVGCHLQINPAGCYNKHILNPNFAFTFGYCASPYLTQITCTKQNLSFGLVLLIARSIISTDTFSAKSFDALSTSRLTFGLWVPYCLWSMKNSQN